MKANLYARRKRLRHRLASLGPFIKGSISDLKMKCGKPECRCHKGGPKHPSTCLTLSREGKRKVTYLSKKEQKYARQWLANYKEAENIIKELSSCNVQILKSRKG